MSHQKPFDCECSSAKSGAAPVYEPSTRRDFLQRNAFGIGGIALSWMLQQERLLGAPPAKPTDVKFHDLKTRATQLPAQATAMISLFIHGGPSHMDLLDPKPQMDKRNWPEYEGEVVEQF